jgi:hypothetical protein
VGLLEKKFPDDREKLFPGSPTIVPENFVSDDQHKTAKVMAKTSFGMIK